MAHHVRHLAAIVQDRGGDSLVDYLSWLKVLFDGLGIPDELISASFRCAGRATARRLYLDLFQPAQRELGRLWLLRKIGVAQEHFASAATQRLISARRPALFAGAEPSGRRWRLPRTRRPGSARGGIPGWPSQGCRSG